LLEGLASIATAGLVGLVSMGSGLRLAIGAGSVDWALGGTVSISVGLSTAI